MNKTSDLIVSNQLPYDILVLIFSFLSLEDHVCSLLVSKPWFEFITDLQHFSKLCLTHLPSLANKKNLIMSIIKQLLSAHHASLSLHGSSCPDYSDDNISRLDMLKFIKYILKNSIEIKSMCFKNWTAEDQSTCQRQIVALLTKPTPIAAFTIESNTVASCTQWYNWTSGYYRFPNMSTNLTSIIITNNKEMGCHFKDHGWYELDDSFPRTKYSITRYASVSPVIVSSSLTYFKLSTPSNALITNEPIYPDHSAYGNMHNLVDLYLDVFNHHNPFVSARVASDLLCKLENIVVAPLAEMPHDVRYNPNHHDNSRKEIVSTVSTASKTSGSTTTSRGDSTLKCFVWTTGNSRPKDPDYNYRRRCKSKCPCYRKNMSRILEKHYQHLKLLYLQYDEQHGIALGAMQFFCTASTVATQLRELHLHANGTLFAPYHRNAKPFIYDGCSAMKFSQYLAEAITKLPSLEIIVLKNEDCCLSQHDGKEELMTTTTERVAEIYMVIEDDVLRSLAKNCINLKEVVIWGPHMKITSSSVVEFAQTVGLRQVLELLEIDCFLSDSQIDAILHHDGDNQSSLKRLKALKLKDRSIFGS